MALHGWFRGYEETGYSRRVRVYIGSGRQDRWDESDVSATVNGALSSARRARRLTLHAQQIIHGHHVVVQMSHDPQRAEHQETHDQYTEAERHDVVGIVGGSRYVQEKNQVNAHLGHGEREQRHGNPRTIDKVRVYRPERGNGQQARERKSQQVAPHLSFRALFSADAVGLADSGVTRAVP